MPMQELKPTLSKSGPNALARWLIGFVVILHTGCQSDDNPEQVMHGTAKARLRVVATAIEQFKIDTGQYPTTQQSLEALVDRNGKSGYIRNEAVFIDPWGSRLVYRLSSPLKYSLYSIGPNRHDEKQSGDDITLPESKGKMGSPISWPVSSERTNFSLMMR